MSDPTTNDPTLAALIKLGVAAVSGLAIAIVAMWRHSVSQAKDRLIAAELALETERSERLRERQEWATERAALRTEIGHWRDRSDDEHERYSAELRARVAEQDRFLLVLQAKKRSASSEPPALPQSTTPTTTTRPELPRPRRS